MSTTESELTSLIEKAATTVEKLAARQAETDQKISTINATLIDLAQKSPGASMIPAGSGTSARATLHKIASAPELKSFTDPRVKQARISLENVSLKSLLTNDGAGSSDAAGYPTAAQRDPRMGNDPRRRLRLLEALQRIPVTSNRFEFVQLSGYSNSADEQVIEGDLKQEASVGTELVTVSIGTVAHYLPVSEQAIADNGMLQLQLDSLLRHGVADKAEELIVKGTGTIEGIEGQATAFVHTAVAPADRINEAAAELEVAGWSGTHVLLHPRDWAAIARERTSGSGEYVANGWNQPSTPNLWGLEVVTSASVTEGTALVFDASQIAILDRMAPMIELGRINDQFARNIVTIRAEARLSVAVFATGAILAVDLAESSSSE